MRKKGPSINSGDGLMIGCFWQPRHFTRRRCRLVEHSALSAGSRSRGGLKSASHQAWPWELDLNRAAALRFDLIASFALDALFQFVRDYPLRNERGQPNMRFD